MGMSQLKNVFLKMKTGNYFLESDREQVLIDYIWQNPEDVLLLVPNFISKDSLSASSLIYKVKKVAVTKKGELLMEFKDNGLKFDEYMAFKATKSYPKCVKELPEKYLSPRVIRAALRRDIRLIADISEHLITDKIHKSYIRVLRKGILKDHDKFYKLAQKVRQNSYTACHAHIHDDTDNALQFNKDQLQLNKGKLYYEIARRDPQLLLMIENKLKNLKEEKQSSELAEVMEELKKEQTSELKRRVIITALEVDPTLYPKLPKEYRENQTIQFAEYKYLKRIGMSDLINEYLTEPEAQKAQKKLDAAEKAKATKKRKEDEDFEKNDADICDISTNNE